MLLEPDVKFTNLNQCQKGTHELLRKAKIIISKKEIDFKVRKRALQDTKIILQNTKKD